MGNQRKPSGKFSVGNRQIGRRAGVANMSHFLEFCTGGNFSP
jgi:hypothetical protein